MINDQWCALLSILNSVTNIKLTLSTNNSFQVFSSMNTSKSFLDVQ